MMLVGNSDNTRSCFKTDVKTIRTSRLYQQVREYVHKWNVEFHTGIKQPKEQVERRAAKNRGKKRTIETRKLMSEHCWCNGRSLDESIKKKISESTKLAMQNMDSEKKQLMCEKISAAKRGRKFSVEHRKNMSNSRKGLHWWNNGIIAKQSKECPGEGFVRGNLPKYK